MTTPDDELDHLIEGFQRAARAFATGDPEPIKALFSRRDDVTLANPFGPAVHGRTRVLAALDQAASRFRDGDVTGFESVARYVTDDLASTHDIEHWQARVGDRGDVSRFELRVTSTFRREDGVWRLVHRHADPIATPDRDGPLRG